MESILTSIKKVLGIQEDYNHFDDVLILHINSVFSILTQLGVGPDKGFSIEDKSDEWEDFLPGNPAKLEMIKTYMGLKVRLIFDPPQSSFVTDALNRQISELEWRINSEVDYGGKEGSK